jgi:dTDP-4-amino-4,6-dideoxygalactose transaminase
MESPGEPWEYEQVTLGFNYRLTELQAALGTAQLARINEFVARRGAIAARYDRELADLPIVLPAEDAGTRSAHHLYPIRVRADAGSTRREVYERLRDRGVNANVHYIPIHTQPYYRNLGFHAGDFPQSEEYYREALSLPMYAGLTDPQQSTVIDALRSAFA